ncbi:MAG: alpha-ketoglutarate-dependent dioxygenase AlkB [Caulobacteraceae bacterium]
MELDGFRLHPAALDAHTQADLVAQVLKAADAAPFYRAVTPGGKQMSVLTSSFGPLGWVSDRAGYRYQETHPETGQPWPAMPPLLLDLWARYASDTALPDSCLINLYRDGARMGLHQDRDEADFSVPVLSISLGDTALFRIGGELRSDPTRSLRLSSGDICVLGGSARRAHHGIDRVIAGSSRLLPGGGRINLTLRRAR